MPRYSWHDLPPGLHHAAEAQTGPMTEVQDLAAGSAAHLVSVLTTARGQVFVKGVGTGTRAAVIEGREAAINLPLVITTLNTVCTVPRSRRTSAALRRPVGRPHPPGACQG